MAPALSLAMALGGVPAPALAEGTTVVAGAARTDKASGAASGTWGTCAWEIDSAGKLTVHGGTGADTPASNEAPWCDRREEIKSAVFESGVELPSDCSWLFYGCSSLTSLDLSGWYTSSVTDKDGMFKDCSPSTIKVGGGYAMKAPDMFPKEGSGKRWRSQATDVLYTRDEVAKERSGVADAYELEEAELVDISGASVSDISGQVYTGKALTPKPEVTRRGKTLEEGTDYKLSYENNVKAGTAKVVVTGRGNYEGEKTVTFQIAAKTFPDVPKDAWYADVVSRAAGLGLIGGYKDGRFGPSDRITRGQVAVMLANYAKNVAHEQASGSADDYASMSDHKSVSDWAVPAMGWCFKNKILSGSDGKVLPKGNATRAEAAKTVVVLHDLLA